MTEPELLPCPFCNNKPEIKVGLVLYRVVCEHCPLDFWGEQDETRKELIYRWNARK